MAYFHSTYWRVADISVSILEAEIIIKWGVRALYLELFISLLIIWSHFDSMVSWLFITAVMGWIYTAMGYLNKIPNLDNSMPLYDSDSIITSEGDSIFLHSSPTPRVVKSEENEDLTTHKAEVWRRSI